MLSTPEQMPSKPEVVSLGQEFVLFDPKRTRIKKPWPSAYFQHDVFMSQVQLEVPTLPKIPIEISADSHPNFHKNFGVSPFNPELGATITGEDFNLGQRITKWKQAVEKDRQEEIKGKMVYLPEAPLSLDLRASIYVLHDLGLCDEIPKSNGIDYKIKPDVFEVLNRVYLNLVFPLSSWVGESDGLKHGFDFYYFHPADTPPLAANPEGPWDKGGELNKGVPLIVPAELNKLNQIKGRFVPARLG